MFDNPKFFDTYDEKMPEGMNKKLIFYELPYWQHLNISLLLDPMHIFKNVSFSLCHHISSKKGDKMAIRKDLISSNTKKKHWPRQENRGEASPSCSFKEGDVSQVLKKDDLSFSKEVIMCVKVPSLYGSTL